MAHGITETDGMAFVGRQPWHRLGTLVDGDAMTAAQAIEAASLDWEVITRDVYMDPVDPDATWTGSSEPRRVKVEGKVAVVREDTQAVFNILGSKYHRLAL